MRKILIGLAAIVGVLAAVVVVGYFVLKRDDIPWETLEAKYANPQSHWLEMADGVRLHYRDQGNAGGPPIILVHGFSASLHTWEPWVERLGDRYRILTLDLPGHGLTRAPEGYQASTDKYVQIVDDFAGAMGVSRFTLGGNSMGGGVAWNYALAHPEKLDALVLVDAAGWRMEGSGRSPLPIFALLRNPILGPLVRDLENRPSIAQGLRAAFANPDLADDAMIDRYYELARAPGHRPILLNIQQSAPATNERLAAIQTPTLILHGDTDNLIPLSSGQKFDEAIPNSELVVFEHVGHIPMEEVADASADALKAFLARIYPASAPAAAPATAPAQ